MGILTYKEADYNIQKETLVVNLSKRSITCGVFFVKFIDKDTKHHVIYIPALELSGYGETSDEAKTMIDFSLEDYFSLLLSLDENAIQAELEKYGFKRTILQKEYSKAAVDNMSELAGFNAIEGSIQKGLLTAA